MLEGYITPLLMSYIDKYIKNIKPSDLQVSFWGGDAVLRNLELRLDVLEKELGGLPIEIQSGKIRELSIHLPWNAIASSSVEVTIQDLELVMKMKSMRSKSKEEASPMKTVDTNKPHSVKKSSSISEQPGYLQGYLFRIINNGKMHIKRMVVKVIEEESDLMLTFNIGSFEGYTTNEEWENKYVYTDYLKDNFSLYKECIISDMTVNLHPIEGLGEEPSQTNTHEPFMQRCSFTGRMKLDFRGNMFVKKTVEVLFDTVAIQVNENQFCLFIHILDWLLAAYYSTKRLKGDKDTPKSPESPLPNTPPPTELPPHTTADAASEAEASRPQTPSSKGWGSWMYSFVSSQEENGAHEAIPSKPETTLIAPSSTYAMSANTVTVTMNVTHKVQVPIFYSMRSFTSPVLHFHFTGCTNKLESVPQTKLFLYTLGIMSVEANITGLCPCVKKFPSSWQRNSTASITEATEKIPVFSSGEHPLDSDALSRELLKGSLFDPTQTNSDTIKLPPATKEELAQVGEPFKSLWISYLYFDVDASRSTEECLERVAVGRSKMAVSPDVVHRLQHFWSAYSVSMEATPSSSKGKVVRGDPDAVTNFDIEFAGGHMIFTPNAHFIPTSFPGQAKYGSHAHKQHSTVPAICTTCEKLDISILQPMYGRNASPDNPQKMHVTIQHDCLAAGVVMVKSLSDVLKVVSFDTDVVLKLPKKFFHFGKCMDMPRFTSTYDSTSIGDNSATTSTWQLGFSEATCVGTLKQLDHFLSISRGWFWGEPLSSRADITPPSKQPLPLYMQLHGVMRGLNFIRSFSEDYYSMSADLSEMSVAVLKEGVKVPVFHGPLNTDSWNTIEKFTKETLAPKNIQTEGKLLHFFMATPYDKLKDDLFPVVHLEMAGCVMSLEPSLIEYLKLLPLDSLFVETLSPHLETQAPSPTDSSTSQTLTSVDSVEAEVKTQESGIWSMLKTYEVKVKTSPVLLVLPSQEMTCPPCDPSPFPLLSALAGQEGSNSALLISLPSLHLESARGGVDACVVERDGRPDSLPWDCGLASLAVFTVTRNQAYHYLLEPLIVKATLAPQQEGSGITVHSDTVTVALSKEQVELAYDRLSDVVDLAKDLADFFTTSADNVIESSDKECPLESHAPSHLSSPAPSTQTHSITLPVGSDISTVSSFLLYQGLSSLWIQVIAPKLVLKLYAWDHSDSKQLHSHSRGVLVKFSIEMDGVSLQADIQEKCTDVVFKLAAMEASLYQKSGSVTSGTPAFIPENQWIPRISSSSGKLFSSLSSVLPKSLSQEAAMASPTVLLPSQQHTSPTAQSNFVLVTVKVPQGLPHHQLLKLSCNVQPFEVCAWLPVLWYVSDIGSPFMATNKRKQSISDTKNSPSLPLSFWPSLDIRLENFRFVIPDDSYTNTLLLDTSSLHLTSALDFPSLDVRLVTDHSAFKEMTRLSLEKQLPPLPLYQLDLLGVGMVTLIKRDCVESFLCTSIVDLRAVYTPLLYLTTPTPVCRERVQATGHSLELNVLTDATLFIGYDQVKSATDVFKSNTPFLTGAEDTTFTPPSTDDQDDESPSFFSTFPSLKVFLAGKTFGVSMLQHTTVSHDLLDGQSDCNRQTTTPLMHAFVYNPFMTVQIHRGCIECELSCFNMAALYSQQPVPVALTSLTSSESVSSLLESKLFATAQGCCSVSGLSASLLTVSCSLGGDERNLTIDIGRPVKLSLTRGLIEGTVDFVLGLEELVMPYLTSANVNHTDVSTDSKLPSGSDKNSSDDAMGSSSFISKILNSKVSISTSQMLLELKLSTFLPPSLNSQEQSISSENCTQDQAPTTSLCTPSSLKEGLIGGWDGLVITVPLNEQDGHLTIDGVQLLSMCEDVSYFIVTPVQLTCALRQHLYTHNLSQLSFEVNCGFLEMAMSQVNVNTLLAATSLLFEVTQPLVSRFAAATSSLSPSKHACTQYKEVKSHKDSMVSFNDDLRSGYFKYTIDDKSVAPPIPAVGEIVFHLNSPSPTMTWCYEQPRTLTHITVLPVPFSVTSNTPIKVKCSLQFWCVEERCFSTLLSFYVSETALSEHTLPDDVTASQSATVWRVAIVQYVASEDEDEVFPLKMEILDDAGSPLPLTMLLSPVSLAASLRINSIFSPSFVPSISVSISCKEFTGTLLHHIPSVQGPVLFDGYSVVAVNGPQELLRASVRDGVMATRWERSGDVSLKIDGKLSMDFVDFRDLVWRRVAYPTKVSGVFKYSQNTEATLDAPPCTKCLSVCMTSGPGIFRLSQGLVHSFSLSAHVWLNNALTRSGCGGSRPASLLLNHYIICNDTMENIHIRQFSTNEDVVVGTGECIGYSWSSHVTSPRQLQLCLTGRAWSEPFSLCGVGVERVDLEVEGQTMAIFVRVTDLGGLQKQVILFGSWKLFSALPFPVETRLCPNNPERVDGNQGPLLSTVLTLAQDSSLPSIVATETDVDGVMFRTKGGQSWSKAYPLACNQGSNRPQLLAEFPCEDGSTGYCWYNVKPLDYWKDKPWGSKISLSPLFAVSNLSPFDLTMKIEGSQLTLPTTSQSLSETLVVDKGKTVTFSPKYGPDISYNVGLQLSEEAEAGSPLLALSTLLLHDLPFVNSIGSSTPPPTHVSLPLGTRGNSCPLQASFERSHLNTITVVLRPEARLTNYTPCSLQVTGIVTGSDPEATRMNFKVPSQEQSVFNHKEEFVLSVDWNEVPLCSKPIELAKGQKISKEIDQKLLCLTEVCSDMGNILKEKVAAQLLVTTQSPDATIESTVRAAYMLHNNTKNLLCINSIMITGKVSQELLSKAHKNASPECSLYVKPGESEPIVFWNSIESQRKDRTLTQVVCMSGTDEKASVIAPSIFLSPKFVRRSFSLPCIEGTTLSHYPHILTRHETDGVTYLVVSEDPSPRFYFQNLCATELEVVECGTSSVNAYPQLIPSGCEVVYEPPSIAKLYPLVFDPESTSEQEKEIKDKANKVTLKMRQRSSGEEPSTWSKPFPLSSAEEKVVPIPNFDMVFISTDKRGCTATMSIIPTKSAPLSNIDLPPDQEIPVSVDVTFKMEQIVVCIDDEVTDHSAIKELLRMYGDKIELHCTMSPRKGTQIELSMEKCQVDNIHEKTLPEYSVAMISRSEHVRRPSLVQTDFPPVAKLLINFNPSSIRLIDKLQLSTQPVTIQLEDSLLQHMKDVIFTYLPPGIIFISSKSESTDSCTLRVPAIVLQEAERDISPLFIANMIIDPVSFFLSASITLKVFLSCNNTPFNFSAYHLKNIYSNLSEVIQLVSSRYVSSAFMNAGWVLGSLEIIGSPGTLIQSVGQGLRDLVTLPYQGLSHSPTMFVLGLGQGATSFLQNCSSGALSSVTNLASSLSRNMEQLSMDPDHASYQEQIRRQASVPKFSSGVRSGVSSFGLSLISAVAGIVDQPMQSYQQMEEDSSTLGATRSILTGVGKGILGVVTKPMGGAMELVSKTGQGIMHGTGLTRSLRHRETSETTQGVSSILRNQLPTTLLKCVRRLDEGCVLCSIPATREVTNPLPGQPFVLIMTFTQMHFLNIKSDTVQESIPIAEIEITDVQSNLPRYSLLRFKRSTDCQLGTESTPECFRSVENYLKEQDVADDSKQEDIESSEEEDGDVYTTNEHYSAHLMTFYHHVITRLKDPTLL